jgi:hypothetical protein
MAAQTPLPLAETLTSEMSLFQLDETLSMLMDSALEEASANNGEIPDELGQELLDYCEAFGAKVDNIANYIKAQECEARNAKIEIERLHARHAAAENRVERLKGVLKYFMDTRGLRSMKGRLNTIFLRRNSQDSLIVDADAVIPAEFCKLSLTVAVSDWEELLAHLPEDHDLRARLANDANAFRRREPDNAKLRAAIQSGQSIPAAQLHRGQHVRLA